MTDQDGQPFTLSQLRGKFVVLDFIFTRCPGPCPLLSLKFSQLQNKLGERFGTKVMLLSVSIDPRHDTPAVLKEYAQRYSANLAGWKFLVGSTRDTIMTASAFGADYEANQDGIVDHRLVTCVIDHKGMVVKEFSGTNYTVDELLAAINEHSL
jgi:protein SCO1/2